MTPQGLLTVKKAQIAQLCRHYGVTRLRLFGSALRDDWDAEASDFDFVAEYGPRADTLRPLDRLVGLKVSLEGLLGRPVDVIDWGAVRNPYFRRLVDRQARDFYAA